MSLNELKKFKLAVLLSHPIQYQVPFLKEIAKCEEIDLKVFFYSDWGVKKYKDEGFEKELNWDIPLLDGYNYEFLKNISLFPNVAKYWGLINPDIVKKLKEEKYDVVWIHGWNSFSNWLALLTAFKLNIPVLLRTETNLLPKISKIKFFLKKTFLGMLFKKISAFLAIGKYNALFYEAFGVTREKIFLVPYCVDNYFFISRANELTNKREYLKEKFKIPKELPVILFSGKLVDVKRPMDLLKAYSQMISSQQAALVYVGDGYLRKDLESYSFQKGLKHVYFMGFKNQTELPELYAMSDIFVLPSDYEPWGLVVNEAMCFGLPVIVTNMVGASGDLIKDDVNGFFYKVSDINSLSKKLELLLTDQELRKKMGDASLEIIKKWSYKEGVNGLLSSLHHIKN